MTNGQLNRAIVEINGGCWCTPVIPMKGLPAGGKVICAYCDKNIGKDYKNLDFCSSRNLMAELIKGMTDLQKCNVFSKLNRKIKARDTEGFGMVQYIQIVVVDKMTADPRLWAESYYEAWKVGE